MKTCTKCKKEKQLSEFSKGKNYRDGLRTKCKKCHSEYMTDYYNKNPDKRAEKNRMNSKYQTNWKRHKLTESQYEKLINLYDGKCHACKQNDAINIDHDHNCCDKNLSCGNCVRGILCHNCNASLGLMKDNKELILMLAEYIS